MGGYIPEWLETAAARLSPGAHAELAQGARHVILDRARAYPEPGRSKWFTEYLLARVHRGDEFQDASRRQVLLVDPHAER